MARIALIVLAALCTPATALAGWFIDSDGSAGDSDPAVYVDEWGRLFEVEDDVLVDLDDSSGRVFAIWETEVGSITKGIATAVIETESGALFAWDGGLVKVDPKSTDIGGIIAFGEPWGALSLGFPWGGISFGEPWGAHSIDPVNEVPWFIDLADAPELAAKDYMAISAVEKVFASEVDGTTYVNPYGITFEVDSKTGLVSIVGENEG